MERPDLDTFARVNPACQRFRQCAQGHLVVRKVSGRDAIRLLRCRSCCEACSERRGTALCTTKVSEAKAVDVIEHLGEGCRVRVTARLTKVCQATVARLLRVAGRHAERGHEPYVQGVTSRARAFAEQRSSGKKGKTVCGCGARGGR